MTLGKVMRTRAASLAWSMCALTLGLTGLGLLLLALNLSHPGVHIYYHWAEESLLAASFSTVGALIVSRSLSHNRIGWLLCTTGFLFGVGHCGAQYAIYTLGAAPGSLPGGEAVAWISSWLWVPNIGLIVLLGLLFPGDRLPGRRWRWVAWLSVLVTLMGTVLAALSAGPIISLGSSIDNPLGIESLPNAYEPIRALMLTLVFVTAASQLVRLRDATGVERQQIKWFAYATTVGAGGSILAYTVAEATGIRWLEWIGFILVMAAILGIPTSMGIAILEYHLYDVDIVINRTLVYGGLTASVVGLYVLVVGGLGALFQSRGSLLISLLATGVVAVVFAPLRERLQRAVNRLIYGERDGPYALDSHLGHRLEVTVEPQAVLPTIVETLAKALKVPYAAIALREHGEHDNGEGYAIAAAYGSPVDSPPLRLPLVYGDETVGELVLAPRPPGKAFGPEDRRLLDDLSRQAGIAAYAVRLTADLQRARERLVAAREEERRRLRRDLHDGLGPQLSGQTLTIDAIHTLLRRDTDAAETLLLDLRAQSLEAASGIRHLVYALRPPALDDIGLVGALRKSAAQCSQNGSLRVRVEAPTTMPPLPAAVEVACYRIAREALNNVVRHAQACTCNISLRFEDGSLWLEVRDDGRGLPDLRANGRKRAGVGLTSMRERAAELGGSFAAQTLPEGGTVVRARLPHEEE